MIDRTHLRIVAEKPHGRGTEVTVNGERLTNVRRAVVTIDACEAVTVEMELFFPQLVVDGQFRREVWVLTADGERVPAESAITAPA